MSFDRYVYSVWYRLSQQQLANPAQLVLAESWRYYPAFLAAVRALGPRPPGHILERSSHAFAWAPGGIAWVHKSPRKATVLPGVRYGKLVVKQLAPEKGSFNRDKWLCVCDCGRETSVVYTALVGGITKTCGCTKTVGVRKHDTLPAGKQPTQSRAGRLWYARHTNRNQKRWPWPPEWMAADGFKTFYAAVGPGKDGQHLRPHDLRKPISADNFDWFTPTRGDATI